MPTLLALTLYKKMLYTAVCENKYHRNTLDRLRVLNISAIKEHIQRAVDVTLY